LDKLIRNKKLLLFITTLQEAFSAIIPFFLLSSFLSLLYFLATFFEAGLPLLSTQVLGALVQNFNAFSSIAATIAIAYFFAIRLRVSQIIAVLLALATFITIVFIEHPSPQLELPYGFTPITLINPIISTFLLKLFFPKLTLNIPLDDANRHIYQLFNYLFVFLFAYGVTVALYFSVDYGLDRLLGYLHTFEWGLPDIVTLALRNLFIQICWFFGVHGSHTVNALMGKEILSQMMLPHLTFAEFNRMFIVIGGSGIGLGLLISLLVYARENSIRLLAKISIPFVLFNINTLLMYAVIVLNRFFIIPFLLLPLLNLLIAYPVLMLMHVNFTEYYVTWTTPLFVDSWLKTGGNLSIMLLQLFLVVLDTAIYMYYTRKFVHSQSLANHIDTLEKNLEIPGEIKAQAHIQAFGAHKEIIEANAKLDDIIASLNDDNLYVYYQPKIDLGQDVCHTFEALIRHRQPDGKLTGHFFLIQSKRQDSPPSLISGSVNRWKSICKNGKCRTLHRVLMSTSIPRRSKARRPSKRFVQFFGVKMSLLRLSRGVLWRVNQWRPIFSS
jgi:cellobiose-specific phosphotransferase system component IIC